MRMTTSIGWLAVLGLGLAGCKGNSALTLTFGEQELSLDDPSAGEFPGLAGVPNLDDDDQNGVVDWDDKRREGEDERVSFVVPEEVIKGLRKSDSLFLDIKTSGDDVRVWRKKKIVLSAAKSSYEITGRDGEEVFGAEFGDYLAQAEVTLRKVSKKGDVQKLALRLTGSPLLLNHHLQPVEDIYATAVSDGWWNNDEMIATFEDEFGERFHTIPGPSYDWDVWVQDEFEFATLGGVDHRMDVVIDSIRDRGLDDYAEDALVGPGFIAQTWGSGWGNSFDSFGNLENSPPVTVDGVQYPFGRIYYGAKNQNRPTSDLTDFLASQQIQSPVEFDTSWLCVGHVDEYSTFLPDPSSDKGFKLVLANGPAAWDVLEGLPESTDLPRFEPGEDDGGHDIATVGEMVNDSALRNLNEDYQEDYMDALKEDYMEAFDLTEDDIIYLPNLWVEVSGCQGGVASLIPGMVNLAVFTNEEGGATLMIPDPFVRSDLSDQSSDPMIAAVNALFPEGNEPVYVDNWYVYHWGLGEVHCGSNATRTPIANWWELGGHLVQQEEL